MEDEEFNEDEENIYDEKQRENQVEDGEISAEEDAFMRGYDEAVNLEEDQEQQQQQQE